MKKPKLAKLTIRMGGIMLVLFHCKRVLDEYEKVLESRVKFRTYFRILDKWLKIKEKKSTLETYFLENHFLRIAIYGMGVMGKHLFEELKSSKKIKILYAIDRNADQIDLAINVLKIEDDLQDVDVVIVTTVCEFDEIKGMLSERLKCPILSLENVVDDIWMELPE